MYYAITIKLYKHKKYQNEIFLIHCQPGKLSDRIYGSDQLLLKAYYKRLYLMPIKKVLGSLVSDFIPTRNTKIPDLGFTVSLSYWVLGYDESNLLLLKCYKICMIFGIYI